MWHRFTQPLRDVVLRALTSAARDGRAEAEPEDVVRAVTAAESGGDGVVPAVSISEAARRLFEQAYEEAARLGDRSIGTDHLLLAAAKLDHPNGSHGALRRRMAWRRRLGLGPDAPSTSPPAALLARARRAAGNMLAAYHLRRGDSIASAVYAEDPYPLYRRLRERRGDVFRDPLFDGWIVIGHAEAVAVLRGKRFSAAPRSRRTASGTIELDRLPAGKVRDQFGALAGALTGQIVFTDPPAHGRIRTRLGELFAAAGTPDALRDRVQRVADDLLDRVLPHGRMDLVRDFCVPLPLRVIAELLGLEREDLSLLKRWSDVFAMMLAFDVSLEQDLEVRRRVIEMRGHFDRIVRDRSSAVISRLLEPNEAAPALEPGELFANVGFLLAAGHETTASTLAHGVRELLIHYPDQLDRLRADPGMIPAAVEELLRHQSPVHWTARRATEDVEVGGRRVVRGEVVLVGLAAANRDPRQFSQPPADVLDLARPDAAKHLAFSGGAHYCLGATLGRLELQIGLATLLRRTKNLRLDPSNGPRWHTGTILRTLQSLPVCFEGQ